MADKKVVSLVALQDFVSSRGSYSIGGKVEVDELNASVLVRRRLAAPEGSDAAKAAVSTAEALKASKKASKKEEK